MCCVCQGSVPAWMDNSVTTAQTDIGEFTVYYHPVCYNKGIVEGLLRDMIAKATPKEKK